MSDRPRIFERPVVVVDTETTGFEREPTAAPVELGAVLLDPFGVGVACFSSLIRPEVDDRRHAGTWSWHATNKTGLSRELVAQAPQYLDVIGAFDAWLECWGRPQLTAFNVGFDRPMLSRIGFTAPDTSWAPCIMLAACDVMGEAGALPEGPYGGWKWPTAEEAMRFFDVRGQHKHRALADAKDEAAILVAMATKVKGGAK